MKAITLDTKIADLLNNYEGMKEILIEINPKFEKLNNPILRRTVAKVAGVKQAAIVGGMEPMELVNQLRVAVGQEPIGQVAKANESKEQAPDWIAQEPTVSLNANEILDNDLNPLAETTKALRGMAEGEVMTVVADFQPEPLIDEFAKKGHALYCQQISDSRFVTYIQKVK
jgi:TusA-related sulfurtransferase